jgi:hypothetical protein
MPVKVKTAVESRKCAFYRMGLRNRLHFGQAEGTPLTLPPFSTDLDWEVSTATAELIVEDAYSNDELTDIQELLFVHQ